MKRISSLLALVATFFTGLVFASAVATTVNGTVQAQRGSAAPHAVRKGDELNQGDTLSTGANSSVVLKFDDGHVVALTSNSRMDITGYSYDPQSQTGGVLLTLLNGAMRTITGMIDKNSPEKVVYRVSDATVGGRGIDVSLATEACYVVATVNGGEISFTYRERSANVSTGHGVNLCTPRPFEQGTAQQVLQRVPANIKSAFGGLDGLANAIKQAGPGQPRAGVGRSGGTPRGRGRGTIDRDDDGRGGEDGGGGIPSRS